MRLSAAVVESYFGKVFDAFLWVCVHLDQILANVGTVVFFRVWVSVGCEQYEGKLEFFEARVVLNTPTNCCKLVI